MIAAIVAKPFWAAALSSFTCQACLIPPHLYTMPPKLQSLALAKPMLWTRHCRSPKHAGARRGIAGGLTWNHVSTAIETHVRNQIDVQDVSARRAEMAEAPCCGRQPDVIVRKSIIPEAAEHDQPNHVIKLTAVSVMPFSASFTPISSPTFYKRPPDASFLSLHLHTQLTPCPAPQPSSPAPAPAREPPSPASSARATI